MRKLAIFDVDGTIFRSSLLIELFEELVRTGAFDANIRTEYLAEKNAWLDRKAGYEDYIEALVRAFMKNIKGVSIDDFNSAVKSVVNIQRNRVYRFTRDLVTELRKKDYYLLAISQSPKGVLDEFCRYFGFDKIYGRFYEIGPSDKFTGNVVDLHLISNKANIVKRALDQQKLDLRGSVGVGDTEGDISFLELVDKPVCFNPNAKLYQHAKRNGWSVVVERKDVIYELGPKLKI